LYWWGWHSAICASNINLRGKEVKFKRYDYFIIPKIQQRVKVITRKQFEFGSYDFTKSQSLKCPCIGGVGTVPFVPLM
jgi:hypothetical protein